MAYQVTRADRLIDTLQLVGLEGEIMAEIAVNIELGRIAKDYRARSLAYEEARAAYEKARESNDPDAEKNALTQLGNAVTALYSLLFGEEITGQIIAFFEGDYVELLMQTLPFLFDVVAPAVTKYVQKQRKKMVQNSFQKGGFKRR